MKLRQHTVRRSFEVLMRLHVGALRPIFHAERREQRARVRLEAAYHRFSRRVPALETSTGRAARRPGASLRQNPLRFAADHHRMEKIEIDSNTDVYRIPAETLLQLIADPDSF